MQSLSEYIAESKALHQNVNIEEKLIVNKDYDPDNNDEIINTIKDILHSDEQDNDTFINYPGGKLKEYVKDLVKDIVIRLDLLSNFIKYIDSNDKEVNDWFKDADCSKGAYMDFSGNRFSNEFLDTIYYELWEPLITQKQHDDFFKTPITTNGIVYFYSCKYKNYIISFSEDTDEGEILGCIIVKRK